MPFITIAHDGKKLRLRTLPDQEDPVTDEPFDESKNIQGSRDIRTRYPQGTILWADTLSDMGTYYRVPRVRAATKDEAKRYEGLRYNIDKGEPTELNIFLGL